MLSGGLDADNVGEALRMTGAGGVDVSSGIERAGELLQPYPHTLMVCHPVAPYVNHLEFDEPGLIRPADA